MKITHFQEYNSIDEQTREEFLEHMKEDEREYDKFEEKKLPKGTKILVVFAGDVEEYDEDSETIKKPESLVEITEDTLARACYFTGGLTCDQFIVLDDGSDKIVSICDEPWDITDGKDHYKYKGPTHDAD